MGNFTLELWPDKAPETVKNFLRYVDDQFYDGTIFHRIISNFMIQGGGYTPSMKLKVPFAPIKNEARKDVKNKRGTIVMARTTVVDSATSQFFINVVDNDFLNHRDTSTRGYGYCVFGKVIDGMDVIDKIRNVKITSRSGHENVPVTPVSIFNVRRYQ